MFYKGLPILHCSGCSDRHFDSSDHCLGCPDLAPVVLVVTVTGLVVPIADTDGVTAGPAY